MNRAWCNADPAGEFSPARLERLAAADCRDSPIRRALSSWESVDFYFSLLRLLTIVGVALYYVFTAGDYSAYEVFAWFFPLYVFYSMLLYAAILCRPQARRVVYLMTLLVDLCLICILILFVGLFVGSFYIAFYLLVAIHSYYFGLRVGLAAALLASSSYAAIYLFLGGLSFIPWPDFVVRIGFLFMIALSLGLVSQSEKRQKKELTEALKAASQAIRLKEEFLETLSHDIRTPLSSVVAYADLLLDGAFGKLTLAQEKPLESIMKGAESSLTLFNRLLEFSQFKAGNVSLKIESIDLGHLVREMIYYFRPIVSNAQVELREDVPGQPVPVQSDRTLLCHVLSNLITNALKYTDRGYVQVALTNGARDTVRVVVEDSGIGIRAEEIDSIFHEFKRGESLEVRSKDGVGLGLAIVKRSLQHLQGEIQVESVYGKGSRFTVTLPKTLAAGIG